MNQESCTRTEAKRQTSFVRNPVVLGGICGLMSAVGYTAANVCLRAVSDCDPVWVSCVKSFPTVALVGPWLIVLAHRKIKVFPSPGTLVAIALAGLFCQLAGNVLFQWSLGVIGIALTVPITLGTIITSGALMGRVFLGEPVTPQSAIAMTLLVIAIAVLSIGVGEAHQSIRGSSTATTGSIHVMMLVAGVSAAAIAGFAYSVLGVVIRHSIIRGARLSTTIVIVAIVGTVALGSMSQLRIGVAGMLNTESGDLGVMILAGICNALAFVMLSKALQLTSVTYVNALNASQVAMAAAAGVYLFREPITVALAIGVVLTALGLLLIKSRPKKV